MAVVLSLLILSVFAVAVRSFNVKSMWIKSTTSLSMELDANFGGFQRLGKSLLDDNYTPVSTESADVKDILKRTRPDHTSGSDYRYIEEDESEEDKDALSRIDKFIQQKHLLMQLESSDRSDVEKLQRIQTAARLEGLLPYNGASSMSFSPVSTNIVAGGLLEDWEF